MSIISTYRQFHHFLIAAICLFLATLIAASSQAQIGDKTSTLDPRLEELVQIVKSRAEAPSNTGLRKSANLSRDEVYLDLVEQLQTASSSRVPKTIRDALIKFDKIYTIDGSLELIRIRALYAEDAEGLENNVESSEFQQIINEYTETGNWFERYVALEHSAYLHGTDRELQAALQKAQLALSIIPQDLDNDAYAKYAKSNITSFIAYLHNLQGNSSLALSASLDYLNLTENDPDPESEIDLLNNLIYAYRVGRNHEARLFLSEHILDLENLRSSNVPGLSEMRIASVMNDAGRFDEALDYATNAHSKADNPIVIRNSKIYKAIALVGLGRTTESRNIAKTADVNFTRKHMLKTEIRQGDLYLAFLLAQKENPAYATQLFNRQLDVMAQKLLSNNSRDTTAMLAALENTRERQAEREAAAEREAELQALTIERQRNLNRLLIGLTLLLGGVALAATLFAKYRSHMVSELEIKTIEAASAEKLKTDFLGMISHELRTPLNGIIGISDFLANYHEDPDIRQKTGIVLRSGNELLSVIESLTDMARLDAGQLELMPHNADLSQSLPEVPKPWAEKAKDKGLTFTHFIDPAITDHHVDEDRLIQCLNILLTNAISFTETGRVHLHITRHETAQGDVNGLTAVVADTGQGMSDLVQSRLFTPFMQADTSRRRAHMGTGLSLAIAYALVEMMGGELSVMSREGRGSEFKIDVPLGPVTNTRAQHRPNVTEDSITEVAEEVQLVPQTSVMDVPVLDVPVMDRADAPQREVFDLMKPNSGFPSLHGVDGFVRPTSIEGQKHILVVDDMDSNRDVLRLILETEGHACSEASDGFAALAALDRQSFDLIVLDIHMMPMDGVETLRRIRGSRKPYADIPVIALTADNAASTNAACMEAGVDLFLTKPVRQEELLRAIGYLNETQNVRIFSP